MYKYLKLFFPFICLLIFCVVFYTGLAAGIDRALHDGVFMSQRPAVDNIIIVGIDERSINEIGSWPWPRFFMAEAIERLTENNAAAIGVAVLYESIGSVPEYDERLVEAAQGTDRLVMGGIGVFNPFQTDDTLLEVDYYILPFVPLEQESIQGFLNMMPDEADGVMRHALTAMRFGDITIHSFPLEVYRVFRRSMGQDPGELPALNTQGQFPIRYVGGPGHFLAVSLWGVINDHYPVAMFNNAIVLIGTYVVGIGEMHFTTPMERQTATHGVEIYANIIQNFLEGVFVSDAPAWMGWAIVSGVGLLTLLFYGLLKPSVTLGLILVLMLALPGGAWLAYTQGYLIVPIGAAWVYLPVSYALYVLAAALSEQHERQRIRGLFGRFVAPEVVNGIIAGEVEIQLGGVVKEITALFVDIRGFTAFSESNPPEKVVDMINRYLALTSTAIRTHQGTIDKFIGDATMALFNAPGNVPEHALCAVRAAWMMKEGSTALREQILQDYGVDLQFGIGINTGNAVVGNMGSDFRMDYTAIGDAINTAARLESNALAGQIIISAETYEKVKKYVDVTDLGVLQLKNKKVGVQVYNVENVR